MNMLSGKVLATGAAGLSIALDDCRADLGLSARKGSLPAGADCVVGVRPEHLTVSTAGPLAATVETTEVLGSETIVHARLANGFPITVSVRGISALQADATIRLALEDAFVHVFDESGKTLQPSRTWAEDYVQHA
jgi:multiple sugar transport system ATP-binding protein